ncbi:hypothetical protein, partial [Nocardia cyriacigeorgica]|uniref:hypothetical protein n=1 Tax=Nocardia cyriacigeorgica TaxID=135487 RepID=UPI00313D5ABD
WEAIGPEGRKEWLLKLQDWLIDNTEQLADVLQTETGKPREDALIGGFPPPPPIPPGGGPPRGPRFRRDRRGRAVESARTVASLDGVGPADVAAVRSGHGYSAARG